MELPKVSGEKVEPKLEGTNIKPEHIEAKKIEPQKDEYAEKLRKRFFG